MKLLGIITEYNPFHNGHLYHLKKSKEKVAADGIICIMNGNFVQRGLPALLDKWSRTRMAIENGVDLVIELPLIYGIRSAEYFALGAIQLLSATRLVDSLVFGSESGEIDYLLTIAGVLSQESPYFQQQIKKYLTKGLSFPRARESALIDMLRVDSNYRAKEILKIKDIIGEPNNILGIEYIKAILQTATSIKPVTIKRSSKNYHQKELSGKYASATAIREKIAQDQLRQVKAYLPPSSWKILYEAAKQGKIVTGNSNLGIMVLARLRQMKTEEVKAYHEIDHGLENRISKAARYAGDLSQLITQIKSKAVTWTRVQRNLLHILFGLTAKEFKQMTGHGIQYLRILGFNKKGEKILAELSKRASVPIIVQPADFLNEIELNHPDPLIKSLSYDLLASDLYTLCYPELSARKGHLDFSIPIIKN